MLAQKCFCCFPNFVSKIIIDGSRGGIKNSLKDIEDEYIENYRNIENENEQILIEQENQENINILQNTEELKYYNEYGCG